MIYLDNAATTVCSGSTSKIVEQNLCKDFFNPSSNYAKSSKAALEQARKDISSALGTSSDMLYFLSGATEANNFALRSGFKNLKGNIVLSSAEHPSVYNAAMSWKNKGHDVRFVSISGSGCVDINDFEAKIDANTSLISIMHVCNETGAVNDIKKLVSIAKDKNKSVLFHSDGVQAFLKLPFRLSYLNVDMYSISAHKVGGPKGIGAFYIKKGVNLAPLIMGGEQERSLRSGTENLPAIMGFANAVKEYSESFNASKMKRLKDILISGLSVSDRFSLISKDDCVSNICSLSVSGIRAETLQSLLSDREIYVGIGSACSASHRDNRILSALGYSKSAIEGAIRISFSPSTTEDEVLTAVQAIKEIAFG